MKTKFLEYYMSIAETTARLSSAQKLKVGAVLVQPAEVDHRIIGTGYNGTPSGWDNMCEFTDWMPIPRPEDCKLEDYPLLGFFWTGTGPSVERRYRLVTRPEVIHAESNCLIKVARSTETTQNSTMFCTHAPCLDCSKLIYQSGVRKVYWRNHYRSTDGLNFLAQCDIETSQI